jgi:hypothetical protein
VDQKDFGDGADVVWLLKLQELSALDWHEHDRRLSPKEVELVEPPLDESVVGAVVGK